jgi:serine/threonine kinase 16
MCLLAMTNTCGVTLSVNYLVDSYRELSGDAMATVILVRNTMSFAMGYGYASFVINLSEHRRLVPSLTLMYRV